MSGDDSCLGAMLLVWPELQLQHRLLIRVHGLHIGERICFANTSHTPAGMHASCQGWTGCICVGLAIPLQVMLESTLPPPGLEWMSERLRQGKQGGVASAL